jgi:CBS-domain-containing membrane protein
MRVEQMMTSPVTTIEVRGRLAEAHALMQAGHFRHLPVVEDGALVGIVADRDLAIERGRGWCKRTAPEIASIMRAPVVTARPKMPIEVAGRLMLEHEIDALPVVDDGCLVGIVTERNLLRALLADAGLGEPTARRAERPRGTLGSMITVGQRAWRTGAGAR